MPPGGSASGLSPSRAFSLAHTKIPEFPPDCRCFHSATSSKFVNFDCERVTPTGLPVQWTPPSFQVHVSGAVLTLTKSASPSVRQPGPVPSMKALGAEPVAGSSGVAGDAANTERQPMTSATQARVVVLIDAPFGFRGSRLSGDLILPTTEEDVIIGRELSARQLHQQAGQSIRVCHVGRNRQARAYC